MSKRPSGRRAADTATAVTSFLHHADRKMLTVEDALRAISLLREALPVLQEYARTVR
jgi:hypothetical protein